MKRILVIDDDIRHDKMMSYLLLSRGFEVNYVLSGEEGLEKLKKGEVKIPDIILLDIMMPGMSGVEFLEKLRNSASFKDVPVIVITAISDAEKMRETKDLGVADYIEKPFSPSNVISRINRVLERK